MKRIHCAVLAVLLIALGQRDASAQCGTFVVGQGANFYPNIDRIGVFATTARSTLAATVCGGGMQSEAWFDSYGGYSANSTTGTYVQTEFVVEPYFTGVHFGHTKHWYIAADFSWHIIANGFANDWAYHTCEEPSGGCPIEGSVWDPVVCQCTQGCPLILDTEDDGFRLTNREDGVEFDLNSDGTPELISWTYPDSDDGWLVLDRNGNGKIDNGTELFGNHTPVYENSPTPTATHGFDALKALEGPTWGPGVPDGLIDSQDAPFGGLQVWRDRNHNGVSEAEELTPLGSLGVLALSTTYKVGRYIDANGNLYKLKAPSFWLMPNGRTKRRVFYDVWLLTR